MKAIYIERYGGPDVLQFGERPMPVPKPGQVLIEVHAASVNPRDWLLREGRYLFRHLMRGFPLILGSDVSGVVVEVGPGARRFKPGDCVFGMQTPLGRMGGYAVQIARALGATVSAVTSTGNVALVQSLGAGRVVDYTLEHFTDVIRGQDLVFDTIGRESLASCRAVLAPGGRYVTTIPSGRTATQSAVSRLARLVSGGRTPSAHVVLVQADGAQLARIATLMEQGQVRSVIDSVHPFHDARKAHEKSRSWRTRGKLVLAMRGDARSAVPGNAAPGHGQW